MADVLSKLLKPAGATSKKIRRGRGVGSGLGKTAGRGQKGQYARSRGFKPHFEGGQTPLHRRLPKRGFKAPFSAVIAEINLAQLDVFAAGTKVDAAALRSKGLIKGHFDRLKVLGNGELSKSLHITADSFSKGAKVMIEAAGGKALLVHLADASPSQS